MACCIFLSAFCVLENCNSPLIWVILIFDCHLDAQTRKMTSVGLKKQNTTAVVHKQLYEVFQICKLIWTCIQSPIFVQLEGSHRFSHLATNFSSVKLACNSVEKKLSENSVSA